MSRQLSFFFGTLIAVFILAAPAGYAWYQQANIRNFRVVRDGVLYRSGQMSISGLKRVVHDYGIQTVVTLRDAAHLGDAPPDLAEEEYCKSQEIKYVRISPRTWWSPDGTVPAEAGVRAFRDVMDCPDNYPVLIHCFAGVHRSGAFCAVYRMEYEHWSNGQAIGEMKACGYCNLDDEWDLLGYLEQYQARWKTPVAESDANRGVVDLDGKPFHLNGRKVHHTKNKSKKHPVG